mmetsp:Transcript_25251/g.50786  ORF Transcript_25251/g.50786 Transcript_25251/m.50786 type:complete len:209 (+) Transcript_25251:113-739(+)
MERHPWRFSQAHQTFSDRGTPNDPLGNVLRWQRIRHAALLFRPPASIDGDCRWRLHAPRHVHQVRLVLTAPGTRCFFARDEVGIIGRVAVMVGVGEEARQIMGQSMDLRQACKAPTELAEVGGIDRENLGLLCARVGLCRRDRLRKRSALGRPDRHLAFCLAPPTAVAATAAAESRAAESRAASHSSLHKRHRAWRPSDHQHRSDRRC